MKQNKKDLIPATSYPSLLVSDEIKAKDEFGIMIGQAIQYEWFSKSSDSTCPFYDKSARYDTLRRYARGEHSTKQVQELLGVTEGEDTYTNYDFSPIQVMPKFVNLVVNQMSERLFKVGAEATDKYSTDLKDDRRKRFEKYIIAKPAMQEAQSQLGVNLFPDGADDMPQSQEEVELHMKMKGKLAIETAVEEALKYTFDINDYEETQSRLLEDITVIGLASEKHYTDPQKGITIKYVDPADMVFSYPTSKNFKNVHYFGEVERITVSEFKRITGESILTRR